jgi:hypothetical protein
MPLAFKDFKLSNDKRDNVLNTESQQELRPARLERTSIEAKQQEMK